jgi:hypothetical protein
MNDLVSTIQGINGSPTYTNAMRDNQVGLGEVQWAQLPADAWPNFRVVLSSEPREREPGRYRKELQIDIICAFKTRRDAPYEPWLEDIEKAILTDVTRNGLAIETFVNNIERETQVLQEPAIYIMNVTCPTLVDVGTL